MRRWNGWGEETTTFPLSHDAHRYLVEKIGEGRPLPDANLDEVLKNVSEFQTGWLCGAETWAPFLMA